MTLAGIVTVLDRESSGRGAIVKVVEARWLPDVVEMRLAVYVPVLSAPEKTGFSVTMLFPAMMLWKASVPAAALFKSMSSMMKGRSTVAVGATQGAEHHVPETIVSCLVGDRLGESQPAVVGGVDEKKVQLFAQ